MILEMAENYPLKDDSHHFTLRIRHTEGPFGMDVWEVDEVSPGPNNSTAGESATKLSNFGSLELVALCCPESSPILIHGRYTTNATINLCTTTGRMSVDMRCRITEQHDHQIYEMQPRIFHLGRCDR
jgi:hypothetical protein